MEQEKNTFFTEPAADNPSIPTRPFFPSGKREFLFALTVLILGCLLCNSVFYVGFNLGFALFAGAMILSTAVYLLTHGAALSIYPAILLSCSLVIAASFARSDDAGVEAVMFCFLILSANVGLCLLAGQNRRNPSGFLSLLDVPRTIFVLGVWNIAPAFYGLKLGFRKCGTAGRKFSAIGLGLVLAVPLLFAVVSLLITADAAFEGLLKNLPDWDVAEIAASILFGSLLACYFYTRGTALRHSPKTNPDTKVRKGMHPLTVNTVLIAVSAVYLVYLISQLAYFSGGFSGILPEEYTLAEYARRGFFEMGWLCAINLGIIALAVGLTSTKGASPALTKGLCLFLGLVTLFLVASASAKMFLYIDAYGLTRLRVLTEVIMLWLGLATATVCLWLYVPKLAYMKVVLVLALVMGAAVAWADVDTVVARYNVTAYETGTLDTVDVDYLGSLGSGATPYLHRLTEAEDAAVRVSAQDEIHRRENWAYVSDFRDWNYADHLSDSLFSSKK